MNQIKVENIVKRFDNFNFNNILTKDMIIHQCYKMYHGIQIFDKDQWFKKYFLDDFLRLIPFIHIYPIDIDENKMKRVKNINQLINRRNSIGSGLNNEELEIFNGIELSYDPDFSELKFNKKYLQFLYSCKGKWKDKDNTIHHIFLLGIKWEKGEKLASPGSSGEGKIFKYYEFGFLKHFDSWIADVGGIKKEDFKILIKIVVDCINELLEKNISIKMGNRY